MPHRFSQLLQSPLEALYLSARSAVSDIPLVMHANWQEPGPINVLLKLVQSHKIPTELTEA